MGARIFGGLSVPVGCLTRLGDALVLLAAATWTMVIILSKTTPNEVSAVPLIFWNVAGAAPVLALLTVVVEPNVTWRLSASAVASVLYLGVLAARVGFVGFVWLTRTYAATRVTAFVFLSPVFGVLIAWAALGESVTMMQAAGALGVASGIWIVNTGRCARGGPLTGDPEHRRICSPSLRREQELLGKSARCLPAGFPPRLTDTACQVGSANS